MSLAAGGRRGVSALPAGIHAAALQMHKLLATLLPGCYLAAWLLQPNHPLGCLPALRTVCASRYQRELPVSADLLLENLLDPSHVHFAHHGVIGSRDRRVLPLAPAVHGLLQRA